MLAPDPILGRGDELVIAGLHRFLVSGPVSSIFCLPTRPQRGFSVGSSVSVAQQCITPRGPNVLAKLGKSSDSGSRASRLLFGVQVIKVAEELIETMDRGQVLVAVSQVVLAELAGGIAFVFEQLRNGRIFRLQAYRAAGTPTLERPVRKQLCPVIKLARPAVQLCSP